MPGLELQLHPVLLRALIGHPVLRGANLPPMERYLTPVPANGTFGIVEAEVNGTVMLKHTTVRNQRKPIPRFPRGSTAFA